MQQRPDFVRILYDFGLKASVLSAIFLADQKLSKKIKRTNLQGGSAKNGIHAVHTEETRVLLQAEC
ncbi:hypothetical protein AAKU64_004036 [Undibacterium sp. GrIS 1.8]